MIILDLLSKKHLYFNFEIVQLLSFLLVSQVLPAQDLGLENCMSGNVQIVTEKGWNFKHRKKLQSVSENEVLFSFKEQFEDSVLTYINHVLVNTALVITSPEELGRSNTAFKIPIKHRSVVTLFLPQTNECINFKINSKYKLIQILKFSKNWKIVKTNYVPIYN